MIDSDELGKWLLERFGLSVTALEVVPNSKQADFLCSMDGQQFIVESKLKTDDKEVTNAKERTLSKGEVFIAEGKQGKHEAIATIIRSVAHQVRATSKTYPDAFKLGLIVSHGINAPTKSDNVLDTLYGRTRIFDCDSNVLKNCYFFYHSELYRRSKDIDAVIEGVENVDGNISLQLCYNPYSVNYEKLKASALAKAFGEAVIDPFEQKKLGIAYIPDEGIAPSKSSDNYIIHMYNPMIHHLIKKYNASMLINIDFNTPEVSARY